jgi:hypothetical protein
MQEKGKMTKQAAAFASWLRRAKAGREEQSVNTRRLLKKSPNMSF